MLFCLYNFEQSWFFAVASNVFVSLLTQKTWSRTFAIPLFHHYKSWLAVYTDLYCHQLLFYFLNACLQAKPCPFGLVNGLEDMDRGVHSHAHGRASLIHNVLSFVGQCLELMRIGCFCCLELFHIVVGPHGRCCYFPSCSGRWVFCLLFISWFV